MPRAARLPPEERRQAIVDATRPLLLEHGRATSTREIAAACGIAEGTIFRVFSSKEELVNEVIRREISVVPLLERLQPLAAKQDLRELVESMVHIMQERARETRILLALLQHPPVRRADTCPRPDHHEQGRRAVEALEALFEPHAERLSVAPRAAAGAVMALSFGSSHAVTAGGAVPSPTAVADILLHGISKESPC